MWSIGPDLELLPSCLGQVWEGPKQVRGLLSCPISACVPITRPLLIKVPSVEYLHQSAPPKVAPCILPLAQVVTRSSGRSGHRWNAASQALNYRLSDPEQELRSLPRGHCLTAACHASRATGWALTLSPDTREAAGADMASHPRYRALGL